MHVIKSNTGFALHATTALVARQKPSVFRLHRHGNWRPRIFHGQSYSNRGKIDWRSLSMGAVEGGRTAADFPCCKPIGGIWCASNNMKVQHSSRINACIASSFTRQHLFRLERRLVGCCLPPPLPLRCLMMHVVRQKPGEN